MIAVTFYFNSDSSNQKLQSIQKLLASIARDHQATIWDHVTRQMYSVTVWEKIRTQNWSNNIPYVFPQVAVHPYRKGKDYRVITLGMTKFGYPDVVIEKFSWAEKQYVGMFVSLVAQALTEEVAEIKNNQLVIPVNKLKNPEFAKIVLNHVKNPKTQVIKIAIGTGVPQKGDPNNAILELRFDNQPGSDLYSRQKHYFAKIFKTQKRADFVRQGNAAIQQASRKAREKLPALKIEFNKGIKPGFLQVKAPFKTDKGGVEFMWVDVQRWKGSKLTGRLISSPFNIAKLKTGDTVTVDQKDVFDYIRGYPDGKTEGNETGKLIKKYRVYSR
jgi:uncharacterized protein YegJ (DUF2314 family)